MPFRHLSQALAWLLLLPALGAIANQPPVIVTNAQTGAPIPYASLGIKNKPIGTVADGLGHFAATALLAAAPTDTLVVSCVGYQPYKLVITDLAKLSNIQLTPQTQALTEVVVRGRQPRRIIIGHNWVSPFTSYSFYTTMDTVAHARLGREIGVLLNVKHPTLLENFNLFTSGRDFKSVTFRLNIYALENGTPHHSLLSRDVLFTVNGQRRGWTSVDLKPFAITLNGPQQVVATVEWLTSELGRPGGKFLDIPVHLSVVHTTYSRSKSAQGWTKYGSNPSMFFNTLSYSE